MKHGIHDTIAELATPVQGLEPYPGNARRGDMAAIRASLKANGQYRPIVVNGRTGQVLAGNHLLRAAEDLGWTHVAATEVEVDDDAARRIVLADNRTAEMGGFEQEDLAKLLQGLDGDLAGTGYVDDDLDRTLEKLDGEKGAPPGEGEGGGEAPDEHGYAVLVMCEDREHAESTRDALVVAGHAATIARGTASFKPGGDEL